jgi:hypothetical protein
MKHRIVKGISKKVLLPPSKLYYQGNFKKGFFAPQIILLPKRAILG